MRWWSQNSDAAASDSWRLLHNLRNTWPAPAWVAIVLFVFLAVFVVFLYRSQYHGQWRGQWSKRRALIFMPILRAVAVLTVLWMMLGFVWQGYETEQPELLVVLDVSESMSHVDMFDPSGELRQMRFEALKNVLLEDDARRLDFLRDRYNVSYYSLADDLQELRGSDAVEALQKAQLADEPRSRASRLGDGIARLLQQQGAKSTAAIVLFTDGATTVGQALETAAVEARQRGIPLWVVAVGKDRVDRDARLSDLVHQEIVFPGDLVQLEAKVTVQGDLPNGHKLVVKLVDGDEVVDQAEITLSEHDGRPQSLPVRLSYRAERPGEHSLAIEVERLPQEPNVVNNRIGTMIRVQDETIRVLMVQDHPSFDYQFLRNLLGSGLRRDDRESAFSLTTVLQDSDPEHADQDAFASRVFPATAEELMNFDVVILGDVDPQGLSNSQMERLKAFVVERGGALVMLSGPSHAPIGWRGTPLEDLLPIELNGAVAPEQGQPLEQPLSIHLTPLGEDSPQLQLTDKREDNKIAWRRMPPIYWRVEASVKPGVRVLATASPENAPFERRTPLICSRFYGAGVIHFHATDESYRWSAHEDGQQVYARYWLQTLRYLCRSKLGNAGDVELTTDADVYSQGESLQFRAKFIQSQLAPAKDDGVLIVVENQGRRRQVRLQRLGGRKDYFIGRLDNLSQGRYRAWMAAPTIEFQLPTCTFEVAPPQTEMSRLVVDLDNLQKVASDSGGQCAVLAEIDSLWSKLPGGRQLRVRPRPPTPLWNSPWIVLVVVGALCWEWLLRRRQGLV